MPTFIKTKFTQEKLEKKLEKIVNKIMNKEKKQSNYPLIIVVEGRSRSGKTSFIKSLFENKDINFTEHSNIGTSENLLYLLDSNIISMHTNITKDEWETNEFKKNFFNKKNRKIIIFERDLNEYLPKYILEKNIRIRLLNPSFEVKKNVKKEHELVIKRKNQKNKRIFNIENFIREYEFDPTRININDPDRISVGIPNERLNYLKKISTILNEPPTKVLFSQKRIESIKSIIKNFPNIEEEGLVNFIAMLENISHKSCKGFMGNLLLVGEPGCGKTEFARQISDVFQKNPVIISVGTNGGAEKFLGTDPTYRGSSSGMIISSFLQDKKVISNPIIIIDEMEKGIFSGSCNEGSNLEGVYTQILEKKNSKMLYDNFYKITFDGSQITYILTANYIDEIPDTITSRVIRLNFRPYTKDEMIDIVIPNIYQSFLKDQNIVKSKFPQTLPRETCQVISEIYKEQPRQVPLYFLQIASKSFDKERGIVSMVLKEKDRDEFLRLNNKENYKNRAIGFKLN